MIVVESLVALAIGFGLIAFGTWAIRNPDSWDDFLDRNSFPRALNFNFYWGPRIMLGGGALLIVFTVSLLLR